MNFFLGTHQVDWLAKTDVPLFVSRIRLQKRKALPRARGPWALDSGGFTELNKTGRWSIGPREYAAFVRRVRDEIGNLQWAAVCDWMCEPVVRAKTREEVEDHQLRTVISYLELRDLAPDLPWVPVVQGWSVWSYHEHVGQYRRLGVDLTRLSRVGVGSVCRRQDTVTGAVIVRSLRDCHGLTNLHGFGFKTKGLALVADVLASADSLAWSFGATKRPPLPGCTHQHCGNCLRYALQWRERLLGSIARRAAPACEAARPHARTLLDYLEEPAAA